MTSIIKTFQIFKAGTHVDMHGRKLTFTPSDVDAMALYYSEGARPAPLTLGHPADDKPDLGTVKGLFAKAGILYAIAAVSDALLSLVRAGRYGDVSASFLSPGQEGNPAPSAYYLKHVGFLGAMAPAVKGLAPLNFSEREALCFAQSQGASLGNWEPVSFAAPAGFVCDPSGLAFHAAARDLQANVEGATYGEAIARLQRAQVRP